MTKKKATHKTRKSLRLRKRKTQRQRQRQRGGADGREKKVMRNTAEAVKLGQTADGAYIVSNLYYSSDPTSNNKGFAVVIAPRYPEASKEEIQAAKYPYEECLFFFKIDLPPEYPGVPPHFFHATPALSAENYRLHPNLYEHGGGPSYSGKVCLGILGTWGGNEWKPTMGFGDALQGIMGILEANPATYEPGHHDWTNKDGRGVLYNRHVLYESIQLTCKAYELVINAVLKAFPDGMKTNEFDFSEEEEEALDLPDFLKPFFEPLAKRAYSALGFLIGKIDSFINAMGSSKVDLGVIMHHHRAKVADFALLKSCLQGVRDKIPGPLRKNIFTYGKGEIWRALYNFSKPKRENGTLMTYNEFVKEQERREEQEASEALAATAAASGNDNENTTSYVYSETGNNENYGNNETNGNKKNANKKNGNNA